MVWRPQVLVGRSPPLPRCSLHAFSKAAVLGGSAGSARRGAIHDGAAYRHFRRGRSSVAAGDKTCMRAIICDSAERMPYSAHGWIDDRTDDAHGCWVGARGHNTTVTLDDGDVMCRCQAFSGTCSTNSRLPRRGYRHCFLCQLLDQGLTVAVLFKHSRLSCSASNADPRGRPG